jgi:hypothetical protein
MPPSGTTKLAATTASTTEAKSKARAALDGIAKPHGATGLSDGNKAVPGVTKSITRTGEQVREAVQNASDQVPSPVQKLTDAVTT